MLRIVAITGAGLSVASGIRPYRGPTGVYTELEEQYGLPIEELLTYQSFRKDPDRFWTYWKNMASAIGEVAPNAAHESLVSISKKATFLEITQNVDGLSRAAGLPDNELIELHGSAHKHQCTRCGIAHDVKVHDAMEVPRCGTCGDPENALIRPKIVMFNENIKSEHYKRGFLAAKNADVVLLVGTTMQFGYLADFVSAALTSGAYIITIDPNAENNAFSDVTLPMTAVDGLALVDSCIDKHVITKGEFITLFREKLSHD